MVLRNVGLGLVVMAGVAGISGAALIFERDALLRHEFGHALEGARSAFAFPVAAEPGQAQRVVAGDEGYWLTHAEVVASTQLTKPLALGDRISIASHEGDQRQLEVVGLRLLETSPGGATADRGRFMLVTCRATGNGGGSAPLVRFIVAAEPVDVARARAKSL
jgi:hypothetical protein